MLSVIMEAQHEESVSMLSITKGEAHSPGKKEFTLNPISTTPEEEAEHQADPVSTNAVPLKPQKSKDVQKEDIRVNLAESLVESLPPVSERAKNN